MARIGQKVYQKYKKNVEYFGYSQEYKNLLKYCVKNKMSKDKKVTIQKVIIKSWYASIKAVLRHGRAFKYDFFIDEQHKVAYCLNCKAACSSIMVSMLKAKDMPDDYSIHLLAQYHAISWKPFSDTNYFKFSFVRNPFERLVSCYESKYHADKEKSIIVAKRGGKLDFDSYLGGYMKDDEGFSHFVDQVIKIPARMANPHFRRQYDWLTNHGHLIVNYVGKVENITNDYEPIREKYEYDPLQVYNQVEYGDWRDYYTTKLAKKVYRKYKKDVKYFGYEQEYHDLLAYCLEKEHGRDE